MKRGRRRTRPGLGSIAPPQRKWSGNLVVEDDIEEGAVHVQPVVVLNEAQFPEFIHEEADAGSRGADHPGKRFLADLFNDRLRLAIFPEMGHKQQHAREPFLGRIKELIH